MPYQRKTPYQVQNNREQWNRKVREHPIGAAMVYALLIVLVLALPTCGQMLKWMDL
jgi:hypothetical protein